MRDRILIRAGKIVAGVDEVGKGCLAGPVYAGIAILDFAALSRLPPAQQELVRDSKTLSPRQRQQIINLMVSEGVASAYAVDSATVAEIERLGIQGATELAMLRAVKNLEERAVDFDVLLIDGKLLLKGYPGLQEAIINGDALCATIAAASIFAKEARDQYMREQAEQYQGYGFERHVGYGTALHLASIASLGICPLHRRNFRPISQHVAAGKL